MYWRTPLDQLLSPRSFDVVPQARLSDLMQMISSFTNPLWLAGTRATSVALAAGARGDQESRHA